MFFSFFIPVFSLLTKKLCDQNQCWGVNGLIYSSRPADAHRPLFKFCVKSPRTSSHSRSVATCQGCDQVVLCTRQMRVGDAVSGHACALPGLDLFQFTGCPGKTDLPESWLLLCCESRSPCTFSSSRDRGGCLWLPCGAQMGKHGLVGRS